VWTFAGTIPNTKRTLIISDSLHLNHTYQYVYQDVDGNKIKYNIHNSDNPINIVDGKLEISRYNESNYALWIAFGVLLLISSILNVMAIKNEDDCKWDWNESFDYALEWFVKCYKEDVYYYYAFGKLLKKSSHGDEEVSIGSLRKLRMKPDYEPKKEKRNRLIENILNK
jgi:hypothetical protein